MTIQEFLETQNKTDAWLAQKAGLERSFVSKLRRRKAVPSQRSARAIEEATNGAVKITDLWRDDVYSESGEAA